MYLSDSIYCAPRGHVAEACRQLERFLTTPPLVRETSRYNVLQQVRQRLGLGGGTPVAKDEALAKADKTFSDIILAPEVKHSVRALAASAANTRLHGAPFRHYLLYGVYLISRDRLCGIACSMVPCEPDSHAVLALRCVGLPFQTQLAGCKPASFKAIRALDTTVGRDAPALQLAPGVGWCQGMCHSQSGQLLLVAGVSDRCRRPGGL